MPETIILSGQNIDGGRILNRYGALNPTLGKTIFMASITSSMSAGVTAPMWPMRKVVSLILPYPPPITKPFSFVPATTGIELFPSGIRMAVTVGERWPSGANTLTCTPRFSLIESTHSQQRSRMAEWRAQRASNPSFWMRSSCTSRAGTARVPLRPACRSKIPAGKAPAPRFSSTSKSSSCRFSCSRKDRATTTQPPSCTLPPARNVSVSWS